MATGPAVILFDGVCNLCNAWVAFVLRRDPQGRFRFAPLQSTSARQLLAGHPETGSRRSPTAGGRDTHGTVVSAGADVAVDADEWRSVILIENGRVYRRSTAALRILRGLGFPWSLAIVLLIVPAFVRDVVYDLIARNRYRWFGRRDTCMIPAPDQRARFLD